MGGRGAKHGWGPELWVPVVYLVISGIWIYGSDSLVAAISTSLEQQRVISTYKGMGFVLATTGLLFLGLRWGLGRERAAAKRVEDERAFREQIIQSAHEGIIVYGPDLRYLAWNAFMERLSGQMAEQVIGRHPWEVFPNLKDVGLKRHLERALGGDVCDSMEFLHPSADLHASLWISDTSGPLRDGEGNIIGVIGVVRDVTDRRRAAEALAAGEREFRQLAESMPQIVWTCDASGATTYFNQHWMDYTGLGLEDSLGDRWTLPFHPDDRAFAWSTWQQAVRNRGDYSLQCRLRRKDGAYRWWLIRGVPLLDEAGNVSKWFGTCTDIHEIREAKEALRISQEKFHKAFHSAPMLVTLSGLEDGRFLEVNDYFSRVSGFSREEALGRTSIELGYVRPEERERLIVLIRAMGSVHNHEMTTYSKAGEPIQWLLSGEILEMQGERVLLSMATDITELKRLEENRRSLENQLHHLQRLETIGKLTSGVSHDMNNVLTAIMGVASVMEMRQKDDPVLAKEANTLLRAAGRGKDLVASLRDFSRRELGSLQELDLNDLVRQEAALLERTTLKKVTILLELEEGIPRVIGEASVIGNALMNLCVNAYDAMTQGGSLTLSTRRLGSEFVELAVRDDGEGMTSEVLEHAWEPFYTTKPVGKGTGLGLSQVHAAVKAHGGRLEIQSEPGKGTRVGLCFPVVLKVADKAPEEVEPSIHKERSLRVLLVDDDDLAREGAVCLLELCGHEVRAFDSGPKALLQAAEGGLDLAILDLNMPGMDGGETLRRLRRLRPSLPVLIATGYEDERGSALTREFTGVKILHKPFAFRELRDALAEWSRVA